MVYYVFAMVGMELFKGKVKFYAEDSGDPAKEYCGNPLLKGTAFAQLNYCKNNFNNVVSSFILLVELTVVNQWHDILSGAGGGACLWLALRRFAAARFTVLANGKKPFRSDVRWR